MRLVYPGSFIAGVVAVVTPQITMAMAAAPKWQVATICQTAKQIDACTRLEASSRAAVLDRWSATSEEDRQYCLQDLQKRNVGSYWSLLDCLGNRAIGY
jgi:hypothetical protein